SVGDLAGSHITVIYQDATRYSLFALIVLAALAVGLVSRMRCAAAVRATASTPTPVHTTSTPRTRTAPRPTRLAPPGALDQDSTPERRAKGIPPPVGDANAFSYQPDVPLKGEQTSSRSGRGR